MNLAVFVSGTGTILQTIIDACEQGQLTAKVCLVIADRNCFALERAKKASIPVAIIKRRKNQSPVTNHQSPVNDFNSQVNTLLQKNKIDFIVLAGFLSILNANFCTKWANKIINIHPSLLPKYGGKGMYGNHVHQAVLNNKEWQSGATVHFVDSQIDTGKIILQKPCLVEKNDTVASLAARVREIEYEIIVLAISKLINSRG